MVVLLVKPFTVASGKVLDTVDETALRMIFVNVPPPTFKVTPPPSVISAVPESRCALTTPLAAASLAIRVRLPFSVVMLALIKMCDQP